MEKRNFPEILYLNFNQDASCFYVGTKKGFAIYNISPFTQIVQKGIPILN